MTENDPSAHDPAAPRHPETGQQAAQGGWAGSPYGDQAATPESGGTPQYSAPEPSYHAVTGADPSYGTQQTANPWSAQGAASGQTQQSVYPNPNPYAQAGTAVKEAGKATAETTKQAGENVAGAVTSEPKSSVHKAKAKAHKASAKRHARASKAAASAAVSK